MHRLLVVGLVAAAACGSPAQGGGGDDVAGEDAVNATADVRVVLAGQELVPEMEHPLQLGHTRVGGFQPAYELTVENPGGAELALELVAPEGFTLTGPATVAPGASATVTLAMTSDAAGAKEGRVELRTAVAGKTWFAFPLTGTVVGGFANPYWPAPAWKLWFEDATPVDYTGNDQSGTSHTATAQPPAVETRKFPTAAALAAIWPDNAWSATEVAPPSPAAAGWWDDAVGTLDLGHSSIPTGYIVGLGGQLAARLTFGAPSGTEVQGLGINYTSESLAGTGHAIVRNPLSVAYTERYWTFSNAVHGSVGFYSYSDTDPVHVADNYDGLFGDCYQSFGRSSSEVHGLLKMLIAGGFMPRSTKELLKRNGFYAPAMLTLFRQALPWVAADGSPLPYEHELRHRPVYLSDGDSTGYTDEFGGDNAGYHQYPNKLHLYGMVKGAEALTTAPPTALLDLVDVRTGDTVWSDADARIKTRAKTHITVWPDQGDSVALRVDLGESVDLEGGALDFTADVVYPNQASALHVEREGKTAIFKITATKDPALPLGRMPVLLQAHVRGLRSNPVFVNIYWPQADQIASESGYFHPTQHAGYGQVNDLAKAVMWNARPVIETSLGATTTVAGQIGVPVSFTVSCTDPEGFATAIYRRADDTGTMSGATYTRTPTASGTINVAFICSDGTGAYSSKKIAIAVP